MFLDIITDKKIGDRLTQKKELEEDWKNILQKFVFYK